MTKVLIATDKPFAPVAVKGIREIVEAQGYELALLEKYTSPEELIAAVADVDAMIIRSDKATKEVIDAAKKLKVIVRAGAGYDNIDLQACADHGVVAMNTPGQNSNAVAELGFGMAGYLVGRIAKGFGMEVYAFDPFMTDEQIKAAGATPLHSAEEMYAMCDYVSLHIPATEKTKKSINYELLNRMPKGAVLINTARKEVINEEELVKLMADRPDFKYISDIAPDNAAEYAQFEGRYFFTPKKMGAQTEEANVNAGLAAARQIVAFLEHGDAKFKVNK